MSPDTPPSAAELAVERMLVEGEIHPSCRLLEVSLLCICPGAGGEQLSEYAVRIHRKGRAYSAAVTLVSPGTVVQSVRVCGRRGTVALQPGICRRDLEQIAWTAAMLDFEQRKAQQPIRDELLWALFGWLWLVGGRTELETWTPDEAQFAGVDDDELLELINSGAVSL